MRVNVVQFVINGRRGVLLRSGIRTGLKTTPLGHKYGVLGISVHTVSCSCKLMKVNQIYKAQRKVNVFAD